MPPSTEGGAAALPLHCVIEPQFAAWRSAQKAPVRAWLDAGGFLPERGRWSLLPDEGGNPVGVVVGLGRQAPVDASGWFWLAASLSDRLPSARYALPDTLREPTELAFTLGWTYGGYRFQRYRTGGAAPARRPQLQPPTSVDTHYVAAATSASAWARDLVNTPANDLGPDELEHEARALAARTGGQIRVIDGEALQQQFPLIAAVGQGSPRAPRLIDLTFPHAGARRVTLVGKGVCFDTGGLDIKTSAGMLLMKKDMGGAAAAMATAQLLREMEVPVDLRVLVPAVENSVDGASFRPGDVWPSRKGLRVEITNTDAEGRLVLADALALASEDRPDLLIDFATLTGAARVALG